MTNEPPMQDQAYINRVAVCAGGISQDPSAYTFWSDGNRPIGGSFSMGRTCQLVARATVAMVAKTQVKSKDACVMTHDDGLHRSG